MKKKGFTLVELLAVIAILAILVIIALPNVMGMFNNAKKSSFETEVKNIIKYAGTEWMTKSLSMASGNTSVEFYTKDGNNKITSLDSRDALKYYVKMDATGKITGLYVYDGTYAYSSTKTGLRAEDVKTDDIKVIADLKSTDKEGSTNYPKGFTTTVTGKF